MGSGLTRRAVICGSSFLVADRALADPFSTARILTIGEYLNDVRDARRGLEDLQPLLERGSQNDNEAVRMALRKPPVSGIRKACSKVLIQLEGGGSPLLRAKQADYEKVKVALGALDDGCRNGAGKSAEDNISELMILEESLDEFITGLKINELQ